MGGGRIRELNVKILSVQITEGFGSSRGAQTSKLIL